MIYREYGNTGIKLSVLGLGGHEFHQNGKLKGFDDDSNLATKPGYIFSGFGDENRKQIVKSALENGINLFDVTIDSEKEALGRILNQLKPSSDIYIQTRPEGMVYNYDKNNVKMTDYKLIKAEASRILKLLKRETIDFFNFAFMKSALDNDKDYLDKIEYNITKLKREGLIRYANADTFSRERIYLEQINKGCFDSIFINVNLLHDYVEDNILSMANKKNMGIFAREVFRKGLIFKLAKEASIDDVNTVARANLKWVLNHNVTSVVVGVSNVSLLKSNIKILDNLDMSKEERNVINTIRNSIGFKKIYKDYREKFCE